MQWPTMICFHMLWQRTITSFKKHHFIITSGTASSVRWKKCTKAPLLLQQLLFLFLTFKASFQSHSSVAIILSGHCVWDWPETRGRVTETSAGHVSTKMNLRRLGLDRTNGPFWRDGSHTVFTPINAPGRWHFPKGGVYIESNFHGPTWSDHGFNDT